MGRIVKDLAVCLSEVQDVKLQMSLYFTESGSIPGSGLIARIAERQKA
jgi:hypothetical protein